MGDALVATIELSYQHYALGDTLTTLATLNAMATGEDLEHLDLLLFIDPDEPSSQYQRCVTSENYATYLSALYPAFLCSPKLRSIRLIRDAGTFSRILMSNVLSRVRIWPSLLTQLTRSIEYPLDHDYIHLFYARYGYVPELGVPRGYERWVDRFIHVHRGSRKIVTINVRQSALTPAAADVGRDSPVEEWVAFLEAAAQKHPEVLFVLVGEWAESDHRFLTLPNLFIPRRYGLDLGHDLAILSRSDLFLGSSSGFAAAATFSSVPYFILNVEERFVGAAGLRVGDASYPFAAPGQILTWKRETREALEGFLEGFLHPSATRPGAEESVSCGR